MNKKIYSCYAVGIGILVYGIFRFLFPLVFPILVAMAAGGILLPVVRFLENKSHFPKCVAIAVAVTGLFGGIGVSGYLLLISLFGQLTKLVEQLPGYVKAMESSLDQICGWCDERFLMKHGTVCVFVRRNMGKWGENVGAKGASLLTTQAFGCAKNVVVWLGVLGVILVLTCVFLSEYEVLKARFHKSIYYKNVKELLEPLGKVGMAYVKTQGILLVLIGSVCFITFWITKSHYALLFAVVVAVIDTFPILGSGIILVPMIIIAIVKKELFRAIMYTGAYIVCQVLRQFIEPKLMGKSLGIPAFDMLLSAYLGLELFGVEGVFTGPVAYVLYREIVKNISNRAGKPT